MRTSSAPAPMPTVAIPTIGVPQPTTGRVVPIRADPAPIIATEVPFVALNAYRQAVRRITLARPNCGLSWALLAAIGRVESNHGRFGGAILHTDGTSTPPIIGIPLNGNGTALILDTDHGTYDRDLVYDRAVGPMQFIPSTWARYRIDGNGDHIADPFNIYDAALSAADYLCAAGGNLVTWAGQYAAVFAYNQDGSYVATVLALAFLYATGSTGPIQAIPAAPVPSANPPTIAPTRAVLPPVNPGPPSAISTPPVPTATPSTKPPTASPTSTPTPSCPPVTPSESPTPTATPSSSEPATSAPISSTAAGETPTPTPTDSPTGTATSTQTVSASTPPSATPTPTQTSTPTPTSTPCGTAD